MTDDLLHLLLFGKSDRGSSTWSLYLSRFFGTEELEAALAEHHGTVLEAWEKQKRQGEPWVIEYLNYKKRRQ